MENALQLRKEGAIRLQTLPFVKAWQKEIDSLLSQNIFKIVDINNVPQGERLFKSRFVDEIKRKDGVPYEKS